MSVQQVVDAFPPITAAQILGKIGAPLNTPTSTQLKSLVEKGNSIDIPALRPGCMNSRQSSNSQVG
jgi:hypothetical protein